MEHSSFPSAPLSAHGVPGGFEDTSMDLDGTNPWASDSSALVAVTMEGSPALDRAGAPGMEVDNPIGLQKRPLDTTDHDEERIPSPTQHQFDFKFEHPPWPTPQKTPKRVAVSVPQRSNIHLQAENRKLWNDRANILSEYAKMKEAYHKADTRAQAARTLAEEETMNAEEAQQSLEAQAQKVAFLEAQLMEEKRRSTELEHEVTSLRNPSRQTQRSRPASRISVDRDNADDERLHSSPPRRPASTSTSTTSPTAGQQYANTANTSSPPATSTPSAPFTSSASNPSQSSPGTSSTTSSSSTGQQSADTTNTSATSSSSSSSASNPGHSSPDTSSPPNGPTPSPTNSSTPQSFASASFSSEPASSTTPSFTFPANMFGDPSVFLQGFFQYMMASQSQGTAQPTPQQTTPLTPSSGNTTRRRTHVVNTKPGSTTHKKAIKKAAKVTLNGSDGSWDTFLRRHFLTCTGVSYLSRFGQYCPVSDEVAKSYDMNPAGPGPEGENQFRLFFGHDWNGHVWNRKVISNIISLVPAKQEEYGFTGDVSQEALEAWMWGFIRDARGSWCQSQPRVHFSGSRMEMPDEARARTTQYTAQRGQRVKVTSHKHHKYRKRKEGVKLLLEHPSDSHTTLEWQRTQNLLNELPAEAMSSEYSDEEGTFGDNRPLIIHIPDFRRRCITTAMKRLDKAIRSHAPQLPGDKAQRHSIRQRERLHVVSKHTRPKKLPRSCYHKSFLQRLTPHVRGGLEVRDKIIPLFDRWAAVHNEGHSTTEEEMDHGEGMDADN